MNKAQQSESNHKTEPNDLWNLFLENVLWHKKRFHTICVVVIVGFFAVKTFLVAHNSVYALVSEQVLNMILLSTIPIGWLYIRLKDKEPEEVSNEMSAWYLGFFLALVLSYGLASIKEQDRMGRELRAKMSADEWKEYNEQIRDDAHQDWIESRHR